MVIAGGLSDVIGFSHFIYYYVVAGHFQPLQLILAGTALEAVGLVFEIPTGILADNYSRRLSIIIGTALMGLSTLGQSIGPDFALILVCQGMRGFAYTFISGADKAWLADEAGEEAVGPILLLSSQVSQVVGIVGVIANLGLALVDLRLPFIVSGLISLGLMLFLIVAMPERGFVRSRPSHRGIDWRQILATPRIGLAVVRASPILILLLVIAFFSGAASEGYDRLYQSHLLTTFHFVDSVGWQSLFGFGLINLAGLVFTFATLHLIRRKLDTTNQGRVVQLLLVTQGLSLVGCIVVGLSGNLAVTLAAVWLHSVLANISQPLYGTWLTLSIPSRVRATVISMSSQLDEIGQVGAGPLIGLLGNAFGTGVAIVVTGVLLVPNLFLYARLFAQVKPAGNALPETISEEV
jgi:MFS family permease